MRSTRTTGSIAPSAPTTGAVPASANIPAVAPVNATPGVGTVGADVPPSAPVGANAGLEGGALVVRAAVNPSIAPGTDGEPRSEEPYVEPKPSRTREPVRVTDAQINEAIESGEWQHENEGHRVWLNGIVPARGGKRFDQQLTREAVVERLQSIGVTIGDAPTEPSTDDVPQPT